jgi:FkbM family methyltransferase
MKTVGEQIAQAGLPIAQWMVRHVPPSGLREWIWRWGQWRLKDFVVKTTHDFLVEGNTQDLIQGYLYWFGVWEPNLTQFVFERMQNASNRTFVDVGANIGYFSLLAARANRHARVVAVEAFPTIYRRLLNNIRLNAFENIRTIEVAACEAAGILNLYYSGSGNEGRTTSVPGIFGSAPILVKSSPLTEILSEKEFSSMRLMKIDVEGAEAGVVKGMQRSMQLLPDDAEIVVEISADPKGGAKVIFDIFDSFGFAAYSLENRYDPKAYLYPKEPARPVRLQAIPSMQTDVVFSRIKSDFL